jgi:hypothetical protein
MEVAGFMHKYFDWAAFEHFVKEIYEADGDVFVERDVVELDRYGAKRQTDVKITRRTRFHTFVTLVECKRWKDPVSRDRIDVLASSIEALGANKGAIFTTTGYEEGAIAYAKGKGIDLFVVRDLSPKEWGLPGRHVSLYLHVLAAEFSQLGLPNVQAIGLIDEFPKSLNLDIHLDKDMARDPGFDLHSVKTGMRGPNVIGILCDAHGLILGALGNGIGLMNEGKETNLEVIAACIIDLSQTDYKQLRLPAVAVRLDTMEFKLTAHVSQSHLQFDRGASLDFALMVESYVSDQRLIAHRRKQDPGIHFQVVNPSEANMTSDALVNDSLMKVICSPWVSLGNAVVDKKALAAQIIRVIVDVVDGKPKLSVRMEALPPAAPLPAQSGGPAVGSGPGR